nr:phosphotransferase [Natronosporangium hydrolyticum]
MPLADREYVDSRNASAVARAEDITHLLEALEAGRSARRWAGPPAWLHGDLHPANLLVHDGRVRAIIDFGDVTSGDPATDLAVVWMFLPSHVREGFWSAYASTATHVDGELVLRARAWAAAFALVFLAHSADNRQMAAIGRTTSRALRDERLV